MYYLYLIVLHNPWDIIIIGDGCAAFMLLEALSRHAQFGRQKIILLGSGEQLDRSWCFWDADLTAPYREMVACTWDKMSVVADDFVTKQQLTKRAYHYLPGDTFFRYFKEKFLPQHPNIQYMIAPATDIKGGQGAFSVHTANGVYHARQVYNSGFVKRSIDVKVWQHFRGWFITLPKPLFDSKCALLMDFNVPQDRGCSFMYVLPLSDTKALVEYTFLGSELWDAHVYESALRQYIAQHYGAEFTIERVESGKIPMQQGAFSPLGDCGEVNIGTLAGVVKAGTGYAFQRMMKDSDALAKAWYSGKTPDRAISNRRFEWYDSLLLWIIEHRPDACKNIFKHLFSGQSIDQVVRFMDEQTRLGEELLIFSRLPKRIFLRALIARTLALKAKTTVVKPKLAHA